MPITAQYRHEWRKVLRLRPQLLVMMLTDALALELTVVLVFALRSLWGPVTLSLYGSIAALLLLGPFFSTFLGANQSINLPPHKEVKQVFLSVSLTYLVVLTLLFLTQTGLFFSRAVILGAWAASLVSVPVARGWVRRTLCHKRWWQTPVVFLQQGDAVDTIWKALEAHPQRGLKPLTSLDIDHDRPLLPQLDAARLRHVCHDCLAVLLLDGDSAARESLVRQVSRLFRSVLLVPSITMGSHRVWLTPRDLEGAVGLLVRQNLLDVRRLWVKRVMDVTLTLAASPVIVPLVGLIALAIKLDSPGPVFYAQRRIGQNGAEFHVYKFRTMVPDADALLRDCLSRDPGLAAQWEAGQKLHNDPRVTRVGKWLRKWSLDELPQLWNVLMGNMSLVGPRPIILDEVERYGNVYREYVRVKPGLTGLWQVSGRNNTSYAARIDYDHYYVTNWSVWLDIWILARTVPVVLVGRGAY